MTFPKFTPLALALLVGCGADSLSSTDTGITGGEATDTDTASPQVPGDEDGAPGAPWFALSGTLLLTGGQPNAAASTFDFEFRDDPALAAATPDSDDTDTTGAPSTLPCIAHPRVLSLNATPVPEGEALLGWWAVTLQDRPDEPCDVPVPSPMRIGIAALDPALYPAMDAQGFDTVDSTLYGLVIQYQNHPIWSFGIAGTSANINGDAAPVTEAPLPDGEYLLRTLHLLPTNASD